ncbi:MAG: M16 family metallopeptidase, partial [Bdellovibrionales bacterium]
MSNLRTTELDNGLRVVTENVPGMHSAALGVWIGVGTRNEDLIHNGAAHMLEHMLFKGTKTRDAKTIAEEIENLGGHMNAYTGRELTSYHIHLLGADVPHALEVLADMYRYSTLPEEEVERERHVILQEIGMCNDTPDDLIFDYYHQTAYPGQA